MTRYKLTIEYDGSPFVGWQRQASGSTVQQALEDAILAFCGDEVRVQGAGRTDAGVHALGQVAHVDLTRSWPVDTVRSAVEFHLRPLPITVLAAETVTDAFDARRSAVGRRYLYRIVNRRAVPTLDARRVWHVARPLDAASMHRAAQVLVGRHDFTSFRATACQARSPLKTLDRLDVTRDGDEIRVVAEARSFLHHQVRNMVGTLRLVGVPGGWTVDDVRRALHARDRSAAGPTAPAEGLYLTGVDYPP
ncbi:MAG: tRNA pseudouridine(38-40) synthase TruA [Inquilinaceae bacterium]